MRWDALFGDLDAQWHAANQQDLEREINELARVESSQATLADAVRGALGGDITAVLSNGVAHHGVVLRVEEHWLLLGEGGRSMVLPMAKLQRVRGIGAARVPLQGQLRYSLPSALRVLARNRAVVVLELDSPQPARMRGVLDQVGADFVAVTQVADGVARDRENRRGSLVVPLHAVLSVMSAADNEL
ncbi:MAG: hypothetical protein WBX27_10240 [Specibacter sp.]